MLVKSVPVLIPVPTKGYVIMVSVNARQAIEEMTVQKPSV